MAVPVHLPLLHLRRKLGGTGALTGDPKTSAGAAPYLAGARGRCPNCGEGRLFAGFLKVAPACARCGYDFSKVDSGDGPAVFVIFIGGFVGAFGIMFTEMTVRPPIWIEFAIWLPIAALVCLASLRPMKGLMIAAQFANKASEHRRDDG